VPENISIEELEGEISEVSNIEQAHHTHVWTMDGEHNFLSTHIVVPENTTKEDQKNLKDEVRKVMNKNEIQYVTVKIDFSDERCDNDKCEVN
jgi:cobalt-zinc-cadmium efflux system protein